MQKNLKEYKYITIWTEDDEDILISSYKPHLEIDVEIARDLVRCRLDYSNQKSKYLLIDFTNVKSVTKEARDYMNSPEGGLKGILGGAFLSNNAVAAFFVNLYFKINKPSIPARFFSDRSEALDWLKKMKDGRQDN